MKQVMYVLIISLLFACSNADDRNKSKEEFVKGIKDKIENYKSAIIEKQDKEFNIVLSDIENKNAGKYIHLIFSDTLMSLNKTEDIVVGDEGYQIKIYRNIVVSDSFIENIKTGYKFEIRKFFSGTSQVFVQGSYLSVNHDGIPKELSYLKKVFFEIQDNTIFIYQYYYPYSIRYKTLHNAYTEWPYIIRKDSYLSIDGQLDLTSSSIYIEDFKELYKLPGQYYNDSPVYSFDNPTIEYVQKIENKYGAEYTNKKHLQRFILNKLLEETIVIWSISVGHFY